MTIGEVANCLVVALVASPTFIVVVWMFLDERRALREGMTRARLGFSVRIIHDVAATPYRGASVIEVIAPGRPTLRIPTTAVVRARFVCDDLFERFAGLADSLTLFWGSGESICLPETADGFCTLLRWARANVPFEQHVVNLS